MKRFIAAALGSALVGALVMPTVVAAGPPRLPLCHLNEAGTFQRMVVAQPAYAAHLRHGDVEIDGWVPDQPGYRFDEDCAPELFLLARATSTDASGVEHLVAQWEDTNHDGVPSDGDTVRTDEFPLYTDREGSRIYVSATVTEHVVALQEASRSATVHQLVGRNDEGEFQFTAWLDEEVYFYAEWGVDTILVADGLLGEDRTIIGIDAPSRPAVGGFVVGYDPVNLILVTFYGPW